MSAEVVSITKEASNLLFKDAAGEIVKIVPCYGSFAHRSAAPNSDIIQFNNSPDMCPGNDSFFIKVSNITVPAGAWTQQTLLQELADNYLNCPIDVVVTNQLDLTTLETLLTNVKDSTAAIDTNTDQIEAKLDAAITELQTNGTTNNTNLLNVITELQAIDANTDGLEAQLATVITNTGNGATETTLACIKSQTDKLTFDGNQLEVKADVVITTPTNDPPAGTGAFVAAGNSYCWAGEILVQSSNDDNAAFLLRNPAASGKHFYLNRIYAGLVTPANYVLCKMFHSPTLTADGTAETPINNSIGDAGTSVAEIYTEPTATDNGTQIRNLIQGGGQNSIVFIEDNTILIQEGQEVLITGRPKANNQDISFTIIWLEIDA